LLAAVANGPIGKISAKMFTSKVSELGSATKGKAMNVYLKLVSMAVANALLGFTFAS
jgi:hypothetical protein